MSGTLQPLGELWNDVIIDLRAVICQQGCSGVKQHDVTHRAMLPRQHRAHHTSVERGIPSDKVGWRGCGKPERGRINLGLDDSAVCNNPYLGVIVVVNSSRPFSPWKTSCLLYTSDAADE